MFDELSSRFEDAVKGLRGEAKISENNINDALKEVKRALLDADVSLSVVKEFISDVKDKAIGEEVVRGVNPGQKFIEVVNKELINIMGNENSPLNENERDHSHPEARHALHQLPCMPQSPHAPHQFRLR